MGLDIFLESEDGERLATISDPKNILHRLLPDIDDPTFVHLGCIDWYGDTVFNHLQIPRVLVELETVRQSVQMDEERDLLDGIADLARRCRDGIHTYLKFYGD